MEEGRDSEVPCEESDVKNAGSETTPKFEHLARATTKEDFNEAASVPPVEAQGLTGDTIVLEGCRSIGCVMAKIAMMHSRFANHVVVLDAKSGRKMAAGDDLVPVVRFVILNENDVVVDIYSMRLNLALHAQQGDHVACARLAKAIKPLLQNIYDPLFVWRYAITRRDAAAVKTLIQAGLSAGDAFLAAAWVGFAEGVTVFLSAQSALIGFVGDIEAHSTDLLEYATSLGNTALLWAAYQGHPDVVEKLLAAGANGDQANKKGDTALITAIREGHTGVVGKLLAAGVNGDHANLSGDNALIMAIRKDHTDVVDKLLAAGVNGDQANKKGDTVLLLVADQGCSNWVSKFLAAGADVNLANSLGNTALTIASRYGRSHTVGELLAAGANANHATSDKWTALTLAAFFGFGWNAEVVAKLLAAGANVEHESFVHGASTTALCLAAMSANTDLVAILLAAGANIEHADSRGNTPLVLATSAGVVAELLAARAKVEHVNSHGNTALTFAASKGNSDTVSKLLAAGANANHANLKGDTALLLAARQGRQHMVDELLAAGANIEPANLAGNTALDVATSGDHDKVATKLRKQSTSDDAAPCLG